MKKLNITKEVFNKSKYFQNKYGKLEYVSESGKIFKTDKGQVIKFNESNERLEKLKRIQTNIKNDKPKKEAYCKKLLNSISNDSELNEVCYDILPEYDKVIGLVIKSMILIGYVLNIIEAPEAGQTKYAYI